MGRVVAPDICPEPKGCVCTAGLSPDPVDCLACPMCAKPRYSHALTIAFEVDSDNDGEHLTADELLDGLARRIASLRENGDEIIEACGMPYDTYER